MTGPNGCGKSTAFAVISSCLAVIGEAGGAGAGEGAAEAEGAGAGEGEGAREGEGGEGEGRGEGGGEGGGGGSGREHALHPSIRLLSVGLCRAAAL